MTRIRDNTNGNYNNCFAVSFDSGLRKDKVILKSVVPPEMSKTFETRDIVDM